MGMIARELIHEAREHAKKAQTLTAKELTRLCATPAKWVTGTNYARQYAAQERLLKQGTVIWGRISQANTMMFEAGADDAPGLIVYSFDPHFEIATDELEGIADQLFELKGSTGHPYDVQRIVDMVTDEYNSSLAVPLPERLVGPRRVFMSAIMLPRKSLPDGVIVHNLFPILAKPQMKPVMPLPAVFWPPLLLATWRGEWAQAVGD